MATIIPRWEWRVFGEGFGAAEAALAALTPDTVEESDELYLLSAGGANVKIRAGLVDIKLLREVDADGLERWEPVMKIGFPLPAAAVSRVFEALGVAPPPLTRDGYTLDQLRAELVAPSGVVRAVHGPQAARPLHPWRLQGRDRRPGRGRTGRADDRHRVRGRVRRHRRRPRRRPRRLRQHQLPAGPCRARRRRAARATR